MVNKSVKKHLWIVDELSKKILLIVATKLPQINFITATMKQAKNSMKTKDLGEPLGMS